MVQRNGARGVVDAKVHTPSGSSEECYVTELDSGKHQLCSTKKTSEDREASAFLSVSIMSMSNRAVTSPHHCVQTRMQSASFHGRTEFTP